MTGTSPAKNLVEALLRAWEDIEARAAGPIEGVGATASVRENGIPMRQLSSISEACLESQDRLLGDQSIKSQTLGAALVVGACRHTACIQECSLEKREVELTGHNHGCNVGSCHRVLRMLVLVGVNNHRKCFELAPRIMLFPSECYPQWKQRMRRYRPTVPEGTEGTSDGKTVGMVCSTTKQGR